MSGEDKFSWNEYAIYVLKSLESLEKKVAEIGGSVDKNNSETLKKLGAIEVELGQLKERIAIRSSVFGAIGALIPIAIMIVVEIFLKK